MSCQTLHTNIRQSDYVGPTSSNVLRPYSIPHGNQAIARQRRKLHVLYAANSESSTPCFDLDCLHTCSTSPCQKFNESFFLFACFSPEFLEIGPDCLHTCSMSPCQAVDESIFFCVCVFFRPKFCIAQDPIIKKTNKNKTKPIWRSKTNIHKNAIRQRVDRSP